MASQGADAAELDRLWREDDARNRALYGRLVAEHGLSHRALNWGRRESQILRFRVLAEAGIAPDSSVLDVGCGTGDFLAYLREQGFRGRYIGIDITPEMIAAARERFPDVTLEMANPLALPDEALAALRSDFVVASGIFAFRREAGQEYLKRMVTRLHSLAYRSVGFNVLSNWAPWENNEGEFRADPVETLAYCRILSPAVALRHDYHPGDFTIYVSRRWGTGEDIAARP